MTFAQTCPTCQGTGQSVSQKCTKCSGDGYEQIEDKFEVVSLKGLMTETEFSIRKREYCPRWYTR